MPSPIPPPCLSIRVPGRSERSHGTTTPAFGLISSYSQRVPARRPSSSAPSSLPPSTSQPTQPCAETPTDETVVTETLNTASSDWQGADSAITQARRTASILSLTGALDLHQAPSTTSPTGTYVSVVHPPSNTTSASATRTNGGAGASITRSSSLLRLTGRRGTTREERKKRRRAQLPAYERQPSETVISVRAALAESPSALKEMGKETEADKLKRLYLCPWDALSPRSFRAQRGKPQSAEFGSDKQLPLPVTTNPASPSTSSRLKLVKTIFLALLILLLAVDLVLLNLRSFR